MGGDIILDTVKRSAISRNRIIAHRGQWDSKKPKNSLISLQSAIESGFGIETDLRDYCGELVISHDIPDSTSPKFKDFIEYYHVHQSDNILALNVKSDGLQILIKKILDNYRVKNYFLFDMSVPQLVANIDSKLISFTRFSDIEGSPVLYKECEGVWFDSFYDSELLDIDYMIKCISDGKKICLVSPELHKHEHVEIWQKLKTSDIIRSDSFFICTDKPFEAEVFFNE